MRHNITGQTINDLAEHGRLGSKMGMDEGIGRRRKKRHFAALHSLPALEIIGPVRQGGRTINEEPMALRVGVERQPRARSCYQRSEEHTSELQSLMRNSY